MNSPFVNNVVIKKNKYQLVNNYQTTIQGEKQKLHPYTLDQMWL